MLSWRWREQSSPSGSGSAQSQPVRPLPRLYPVHPLDGEKNETTLDIIAVHGIETGSPKTWVAYERDEPPRGRGFNWLKDADMLPARVKCARIWLFDCNANYSHDVQHVRFPGLSTVLLHSMQDRAEDFRSRPIAFIGSCFGGIVVAEALAKAVMPPDNPLASWVFDQTIGVVFLGSPLRGTKAAKLASWRTHLSSVLQTPEPSLALISDIEENSSHLESSIEAFSKLARTRHNLQIKCFYETRTTQVMNALSRHLPFKPQEIILVEKSSACLDGYESVPLEVRHAMMNKYRGPNDVNFNLVAGRIQEIVEHHHKAPSLTEDEKQLMRVLSFDYLAQKDINSKRVPGTCEWFLNHPRYQTWRDATGTALLWVTADPGCGKSVLARTLIDESLLTSVHLDAKRPSICYYFFKDDSERGSIDNAFRSLLHQLFDQNPHLIQLALDEFYKHGENIVTMLWAILRDVLTKIGTGPVICVLDGLDECELRMQRQLVFCINELIGLRNTSEPGLKIIAFSRPYLSIRTDFGMHNDDVSSIQLKGEDEIPQISKEINLFIEHMLPKICAAKELDKIIQDRLIAYMKGFKNRTYIWVTLMLAELRYSLESSSRSLKNLLKSIPTSVEEAYNRILRRAADPRQAKTILGIVLASDRPLSLLDINMMLGLFLDPKIRSLEAVQYESPTHFENKVRNLCGLFVTMINKRVFLLHQTAKEFLVSAGEPLAWSPTSWMHCFSLAEENYAMLKTCVTYLILLDRHQNSSDRSSLSSQQEVDGLEDQRTHEEEAFTGCLLDYSSNAWTAHLRQAAIPPGSSICQDALQICNMESTTYSLWITALPPSVVSWHLKRYPLKATILLLAYFGLTPLMKTLLSQGIDDINVQDSHGLSALHVAVKMDHPEAVEFLLLQPDVFVPHDILVLARSPGVTRILLQRRECDVNASNKEFLNGLTLLSHSCFFDDIKMVKLLLAQPRVDINLRDKWGRTALLSAAQRGQIAAVRLLLERADLELTVRDDRGQNALHYAVVENYAPLVQLLTQQKHMDKNSCDCDGNTPLTLAIRAGAREAVEVLLKHDDVERNMRTASGRTPLGAAIDRVVEEDNMDMVELLLQHSFDVDFQDDYGQTALAEATINALYDVVKLLLRHSADPLSRDSGGWTPFRHAIESRNVPVLDLFLRHPKVEVNALDETDLTPLMVAAYCGSAEAVKPLLARADMDIGKTNQRGDTALTVMIRAGHLRVLEQFLENTEVDLNSKDLAGCTPIQHAREQLRGVQAEERAAEDALKSILDRESPQSYHARGWSIEVDNKRREVANCETIITTLIQHGAKDVEK